MVLVLESVDGKPPLMLSILVPAYSYPEGLERILESFSPLHEDVEVIVFDDSLDVGLERVIERYQKEMLRLKYRHNITVIGRALGPVANWNALIEEASGEYCILMHHDEMPIDKSFVEDVMSILQSTANLDVVILQTVLLNEALKPMYTVAPNWLRQLVIRYAPGYLFMRNLIGPTGALIIKRTIIPVFNMRLRWLVDVEFYVKLFGSDVSWGVSSSIFIGSILRKSGTITAQLKYKLSEIDKYERSLLVETYPEKKVWLTMNGRNVASLIESVVWYALRGCNTIISWYWLRKRFK